MFEAKAEEMKYRFSTMLECGDESTSVGSMFLNFMKRWSLGMVRWIVMLFAYLGTMTVYGLFKLMGYISSKIE